MDLRTTRLLRGICADLTDFVLPEIGENGDAVERVVFMIRVLRRLADEGDAIPSIAADTIAALEAAIPCAREEMTGLSDAAARITQLRGIANSLIDERRADVVTLQRMAEADRVWCAARAAASDSFNPSAGGKPPILHKVYDLVTAETVTAYLRRIFPADPDIRATDVRILPGGRSKKTIMIGLTGTDRFPSDLIMRQQDTGHLGTTLVEEFAVLDAIARADSDLPLPTPFHFERAVTELGGPFLLMKRLPGQALGGFEGFEFVSDTILDDLATALARLHALDPVALAIADGMAGADCGARLRAGMARAGAQWRDNKVEPSPLIAYCFDWLERQSYELDRTPACVHGDMRPHNLMGTADGLTGILDWELFHIGDPAEDLAYFRPVAEQAGKWRYFLDAYVAAGGQPVSDKVLAIHAAAGLVRNASFAAKSARLHLDGEVDEFTRGAVGYYAVPMLETQLAKVLAGYWD